MAVEQRTEGERISGCPRAVRAAQDRDHAARRRPRRGRPRRGRRRQDLRRFRRRARLPEHRPRPARCRRGHPRAGRHATSTSASWSGSTSRTWRSAAGSRELSPCSGESQKSLLLNCGAEAVENAVKIARAATGKPAVVVFEHALPRPDAADDDDDAQGRSLQAGLRAVRARGLPRPGAVSVPRRDAGRRAARGRSSSAPRPSTRSVACVVARAGAGRGRVHPACRADFPRAAARALPRARDPSTSTTRCSPASAAPGPVWAIEHYGVEPDLLVSGKSLGGGLPLAAVTGRAELMDAPEAGGPRRHVRREPGRLRSGRGGARRDRARRLPPALRGAREPSAGAPGRDRARASRTSARCAASARCSPSSSSTDRESEGARRGARQEDDCRRPGARADPPLVRHLRQRDPHPRPARHRRRRSRPGSRDPGGVACRRRSRLTSGSKTSASRYGDVVAVDGIDLEIPRRRVLHDARPVRLGQDDDAAADRRLRVARRGARPAPTDAT